MVWAAAMRRIKIGKSMANAAVAIGSVLRWSAKLEVAAVGSGVMDWVEG